MYVCVENNRHSSTQGPKKKHNHKKKMTCIKPATVSESSARQIKTESLDVLGLKIALHLQASARAHTQAHTHSSHPSQDRAEISIPGLHLDQLHRIGPPAIPRHWCAGSNEPPVQATSRWRSAASRDKLCVNIQSMASTRKKLPRRGIEERQRQFAEGWIGKDLNFSSSPSPLLLYPPTPPPKKKNRHPEDFPLIHPYDREPKHSSPTLHILVDETREEWNQHV